MSLQAAAIAGSVIHSVVLARKASPWRGRGGQPLFKRTRPSFLDRNSLLHSIRCKQAPDIERNESARAPQLSGRCARPNTSAL